jgi:O-antigen ligase
MIAQHKIVWGSSNEKIRQLASTVLAWRKEFDTLFVLSCFTMILCLLLGGGTRSGFLSDAVLQFLAIPLFLVALGRCPTLLSSNEIKKKEMRFTLLLCVAVALVPALQLIPLPAWIWTWLPSRAPLEETFDLLGRPKPWMPVSVSPNSTWLSALSLLPPCAVFLASIQLNYRQRRLLSLFILALGTIGIFVGLVQVAQGPLSKMRFFSFTNETEAVGFFANKNHFAALIYALILLTAAWTTEVASTVGASRDLKQLDAASILPLIGSFIVLVVLLSGQAMARSRAGLGLTIIALCGIFCLAFTDRRNTSGITPAKLILGSTALAVVFSIQFALYRILVRFDMDPLADARLAFARTTIAAAVAYMPFGSGMGTFVPIYAMFEQPRDAMVNTFANHAHDDFLEVWLEAGVLGIGLIGAFAVWFVRNAVKIWRRLPAKGKEIDLSLARSATMIIALLIAHSFVDYPLRTGAMTAIFAFCCALLIDPLSGSASEFSPEDENQTDNITRRNAARKTRGASTLAERHDDNMPTRRKPAGGRWGEDIDWPDEWCNRTQA